MKPTPWPGDRRTGRAALGLAAALVLIGGSAHGVEPLRIASASNFAAAMQSLRIGFEETADVPVVLSFGSTGKHYAQVRNGAPFDLFFAADVERPRRLEDEGKIVPGTRFTYAVGALVLWSPDPARVDPEGRVLRDPTFRHLAVANPRLAPYGLAARETMEALGCWAALQRRLVRGENIAQALHFVRSGSAELGFVAAGLVPDDGSRWVVPQALYRPIEQQAVLLREGRAARAFLSFVRSEAGRAIIVNHRYGVP